ncbi:MAG: hypothetical protein GY928_09185, partial [Colwellia sp.]|nr:hypothetical protein [Colwellia sp.]
MSTPYSANALFQLHNQTNYLNESDVISNVFGDVVFDGFNVTIPAGGYFQLPDIFNQQTNKYRSIGFWAKLDKADNKSLDLVVGSFSEDYGVSYLSLDVYGDTSSNTIRFRNKFPSVSSIGFTEWFPDSSLNGNEWVFIVSENTSRGGKGSTNLNDLTLQAAMSLSTYAHTDSRCLIRNYGAEIEICGLTIWDGDDYSSEVLTNYKLSLPPFSSSIPISNGEPNFKPSFPHPYRMVKIENRSAGNWNIPDKAANDVMFFSTLPSDNGYGESIRTILNKDVKIGAINSTVSEGVEKVGSMTFSISNLDKFYSQMVEANARNPFQNCIISVYECSGRVAGLFYDGSVWKDETGSTRVFTPSVEYPFTDAFEKTFEGRIDGVNQGFDRVSFTCISAESEMNNLIGSYQLDNGNPTSKSEISPIVIGDLSDGVSPILLTRKLEEYPKAILSENTLDATTQGQLLVYDDENEKLHDVKNKQSLVNTNTIEFYDSTAPETVTTYYADGLPNDYIQAMDGSEGELKILRTDEGEVLGKATNANNFRSSGTSGQTYRGPRFFEAGYNGWSIEGSRDFDKSGNKAASTSADLGDNAIT